MTLSLKSTGLQYESFYSLYSFLKNEMHALFSFQTNRDNVTFPLVTVPASVNQ